MGHKKQKTNEQTLERKQKEAKKEYLLSYKKFKQEALRLEGELEEIRIHKISPGMVLSDMPTAKNQKDLSDYMVRCEDLMQEILQARMKAVERFAQVRYCIENMQDENEKAVLSMKYLKGYKWEEIADKLHVGQRHIYRIYNYALNHFEMDVTVRPTPVQAPPLFVADKL